jgi:hypothetical protein
VVVALVAVGMSAGPAAALDEAQITDVTCDGLRVTQRGLPADQAVEVAVIETSSGRTLAEVDARASTGGLLDLRVPVALRGVRQIVVEVEAGHTEYGEAGADLPQPCTRSPSQPVLSQRTPTSSPVASPRMIGPVVPGVHRTEPAAGTTPSPAAGASSTAEDGVGWRVVLAVVAALGLLLAGAVAMASRVRR